MSASITPREIEQQTVIDSTPDSTFDDIAGLAAHIARADAAFIIFEDGVRQVVKAGAGENKWREATLALGISAFVVHQQSAQVIPNFPLQPDHQNATSDETATIRFCAGVPICTGEGHIIGTLCVVAGTVQTLLPEQETGLKAIARQIETLLKLRDLAAIGRQAAETTRQRQAQLQGITDALPALIAFVDTDQRYRFNNRAYEEWVGVPREQVTGKTLREVLGEGFYANIEPSVRAALAGQTVTYEQDQTWPDGTTRSVRGTYAPHSGEDGAVEGFAVLVTDETENKRISAERRVAAERHASLVAAQQEVALADRNLDAVLGIITRRAQEMTRADGAVVELADGEDMVYRAASGTAAEQVGLRLRRATSLSGRCVEEGRVLVCEDAETDPRVDRDACRRIGLRSMVVVPLLFLGRTVGVLKVYSALPHAFPPGDLPLLEMMVSLIVAAMSAVSENEARTALSSSEQRLHALITSVPVILFALDADGILTQAEGKGMNALGLKPSELVGRSFRDIFADTPDVTTNIEQGLLGKAHQWLAEIDGIYFEIKSQPQTDVKGNAAGLIGVAFDVTERVRAEQAVRQSAARQRQFLRDVLASVTEGRLILCQSESELPSPLSHTSGPILLTPERGLRELRQAAWRACDLAGLSEERGHDMITAVSEAGMNCVVHVGLGTGNVHVDTKHGTVQVRIIDHGSGIALENLPNATLKKGFTTAGTLGHGMKMMLQTADRVYLLTNSSGTTVVVEQERVAPLPTW